MRPWKPKRSVVAKREAAYALVDARAGESCEMCALPAPVGGRERSHRSHAGFGGAPSTLRASNLLLSCLRCNRRLSDDAEFAEYGRQMGWLIGRGADPTTTPVYVAGLGWVLLNDEGTYTPTKETL
jgi:hypothetical protein